MNTLQQETSVADFISTCLQEPTWTVETAINVLTTIQLHKKGITNVTNIGLINRVQEECAEFIHEGINTGSLQGVKENSGYDRIKDIASGVAGGLGLKSIIGLSGSVAVPLLITGTVSTPLLVVGGIAVAAYKFLPCKESAPTGCGF